MHLELNLTWPMQQLSLLLLVHLSSRFHLTVTMNFLCLRKGYVKENPVLMKLEMR